MRECEVCAVCASGITLKRGKEECFVDFQACAANAPIQKGGNCVALRNAATLEFAFFTVPPTIVCFQARGWKKRFGGQDGAKRFEDLQAEIEKYGYSTAELS